MAGWDHVDWKKEHHDLLEILEDVAKLFNKSRRDRKMERSISERLDDVFKKHGRKK